MKTDPDRRDALREQVRARYAAVAATGREPSTDASTSASSDRRVPDAAVDACCDASQHAEAAEGFGVRLYEDGELAGLPDAATLASLGCGNPTAVAELREGETVLDLGSGGGIDVLLSARRVGPTGFVYGLDMTAEMLELARRNAAEAGVENVRFLQGEIEDIPIDDATVDVIISNCVLNLSVDKPAVLAEMHRVLVPGGRIGISDVVAEDHLDAADRAARGSYVGCIAGALSQNEYCDGLAAVGMVEIDITRTHRVADGMHSAIVRARKPA